MKNVKERCGVVQRAVLFVNLHKTGSDLAAEEIRGELEKRDVQVTLFTFDGSRRDSIPQGEWDIAFSLGGDGTVLYAARMLASAGTPVLPLHFGTLGFLAGVERHEWLTVYQQWINGTARISSRCMLDVIIERDGHNVMCSTCLNDAVISASGIAKLIRLDVKTEIAGGEYADLGCYRSDGLIIATPTGSTAYSMAAGGPILDPEMEAVILSPVCPFTLSNRPMVRPSRQTLLVTVEKQQRSGVLLTIDGQDTFDLLPEDNIVIRHSPHYARLITVGHAAYYSALRGKLSWGGGIHA
jgi:NAD+ kinase